MREGSQSLQVSPALLCLPRIALFPPWLLFLSTLLRKGFSRGKKKHFCIFQDLWEDSKVTAAKPDVLSSGIPTVEGG